MSDNTLCRMDIVFFLFSHTGKTILLNKMLIISGSKKAATVWRHIMQMSANQDFEYDIPDKYNIFNKLNE